MAKFDPTKPVRRRDGQPARIICPDRGDLVLPIVACYGKETDEGVSFHDIEGRRSSSTRTVVPSDGDLVNVPVKRVKWIVMRCIDDRDDDEGLFESSTYTLEEHAVNQAKALLRGGQNVSVVRIEFEDGEGIE